MAIQRLEVSGYRSFKHATWQPGNLNLLVGPNASGKSNLLRLLALISASASGRLATTIRSEGGMVPICWNHEASTISWRLTIDPVDEGRDRCRDAVTYDVQLPRLADSSSYEISIESLANRQIDPANPYWIYQKSSDAGMVFSQAHGKLVPVEGYETNETLLSQLGDPFVNPIPLLTRRKIEQWRLFTDIDVRSDGPLRRPTTSQPAAQLADDGANLASVLFTHYDADQAFRAQIDDGMGAAFGSDYERCLVRPIADGQIQLAIKWRSSRAPHSAAVLSDGTLRYLFLIVALSLAKPGDTLAFDEPETGLHPRMFPLVAEFAKQAALTSQVILSTHSAEFLDCFTDAQPNVSVFTWEGGQTRLVDLPAAAFGTWLQRYRLGELFTSGELELLANDRDKQLAGSEPAPIPTPDDLPPANAAPSST